MFFFMDFETLKSQIREDIKLTERNVLQKSIDFASIYQKYLEIFTTELSKLKSLQITLDKNYGELLHHYKFTYEFKLNSASEIEAHVKSDQKYITNLELYNTQENLVKFLEKTLSNISAMQYSIKNIIEYKKLVSGD